MTNAQRQPHERPDASRYLAFESEEAFRAWSGEQGPEAEQFAESVIASDQELLAWRAAGNSGWPPGSISRHEYERQRALRSQV